MDSNTYQHIASEAALIASRFPEAAEQYRRDRFNLDDSKNMPEGMKMPESMMRDLQHSYRTSRDECNQWQKLLGELTAKVFVNLPEVHLTLLQLSIPYWQDEEGFDWRALKDELQIVQKAALAKMVPPPERLTPELMTILEIHKQRHPETVQQKALSKPTNRSERSITNFVVDLIQRGLLYKPDGDKSRKGTALTLKGLEYLKAVGRAD